MASLQEQRQFEGNTIYNAHRNLQDTSLPRCPLEVAEFPKQGDSLGERHGPSQRNARPMTQVLRKSQNREILGSDAVKPGHFT